MSVRSLTPTVSDETQNSARRIARWDARGCLEITARQRKPCVSNGPQHKHAASPDLSCQSRLRRGPPPRPPPARPPPPRPPAPDRPARTGPSLYTEIMACPKFGSGSPPGRRPRNIRAANRPTGGGGGHRQQCSRHNRPLHCLRAGCAAGLVGHRRTAGKGGARQSDHRDPCRNCLETHAHLTSSRKGPKWNS